MNSCVCQEFTLCNTTRHCLISFISARIKGQPQGDMTNPCSAVEELRGSWGKSILFTSTHHGRKKRDRLWSLRHRVFTLMVRSRAKAPLSDIVLSITTWEISCLFCEIVIKPLVIWHYFLHDLSSLKMSRLRLVKMEIDLLSILLELIYFRSTPSEMC